MPSSFFIVKKREEEDEWGECWRNKKKIQKRIISAFIGSLNSRINLTNHEIADVLHPINYEVKALYHVREEPPFLCGNNFREKNDSISASSAIFKKREEKCFLFRFFFCSGDWFGVVIKNRSWLRSQFFFIRGICEKKNSRKFVQDFFLHIFWVSRTESRQFRAGKNPVGFEPERIPTVWSLT